MDITGLYEKLSKQERENICHNLFGLCSKILTDHCTETEEENSDLFEIRANVYSVLIALGLVDNTTKGDYEITKDGFRAYLKMCL